jgi:iduronate 2-sulfatase
MMKISLNRREFFRLGALTAATGVGLGWSGLTDMTESHGASGRSKHKPNVLFIAADDLRCNLGCYGDTLVKSPNLDRLARRGVTFEWAYCQQALCNPSRASLLTGRRPDSLGIWNLETHFRQVIPDIVTLPQWFKRHGYFTQNIGKIFHNWRQDDFKGDPASWSVPAVMHYGTHGSDKAVVDGPLPPNLAKDRTTECRDVPDEAYFDGRIAAKSVEALRELKALGQPFFLAVGFWKPHSPFNAPKRYWDLYDRERVPLPAHPQPPKDVPEIALHNSREILGTKGRKLSKDAVREIRHGYLAAISYLDAQVGKVLDELDRLDLTDNTVVVFWADHGYHLGEKSLWAKTSNFELDARVPLIIAAPKLKTAHRKTEALAELLDLYPTLAELCGLPEPEGVQGRSLVPVLKNPEAKVKDAAFTQHPRPAYYKGRPDVMGYSVRTARYRYTEWRDWETGKTVARELYAHDKDPAETRNIAGMAEMKGVVAELSRRLPRSLRLGTNSGRLTPPLIRTSTN